MIAHFHHCIEQLDLAAQQFHKSSSAYARFALILTDNVLELLLHRFAEHELKWDEMFRTPPRQKYSHTERTKVLGQHFEEKVKFAQKLGVFTEDAMVFVLIAHRYRNQLYHRGITHEPVIYDIAWHYHDLTCRLMPRLQKGAYSWREGDAISDVVVKYCGQAGLTQDPHRQLPDVAEKLASAKPAVATPLPKILSKAATGRLQRLDEDIDFLINDSPGKPDRQTVIFNVQAWPFLLSGEAEGSIELQPGDQIKSIREAFELLRQQWKPPIRHDPIPRWNKRAASLADEQSPLTALQKYQDLMDEMDDFDENVCDAAIALNENIHKQ